MDNEDCCVSYLVSWYFREYVRINYSVEKEMGQVGTAWVGWVVFGKLFNKVFLSKYRFEIDK
jgi:hypothetical protein